VTAAARPAGNQSRSKQLSLIHRSTPLTGEEVNQMATATLILLALFAIHALDNTGGGKAGW
jgi:hypothetical protein